MNRFVPEWRLCHAPYARCTLCCAEVRDDYVWRFWETPASYVACVCQVCAADLPARQATVHPDFSRA